MIIALIVTILLIIPIAVMSENYTVKTVNQTISIVVKPNNTIIVEPQNTTKLEKLVQTLADKQTSSWSRGDLIIASSTIVAFFSFGSFLIIRFKSTSRKQKLANLLDGVIASTFLIQVLHLSVIAAIVNGTFKDADYSTVVLATVFLLGIIGLSIRKIIHVENNIDKIRKEKDETLKNFLDYVGEKYNIEILDSQKTLDEFENKSTKKDKKQDDEKNKKIDDEEVL